MSPEAAEADRLSRLRRAALRDTWLDPMALLLFLSAILFLIIRCLKH